MLSFSKQQLTHLKENYADSKSAEALETTPVVLENLQELLELLLEQGDLLDRDSKVMVQKVLQDLVQLNVVETLLGETEVADFMKENMSELLLLKKHLKHLLPIKDDHHNIVRGAICAIDEFSVKFIPQPPSWIP